MKNGSVRGSVRVKQDYLVNIACEINAQIRHVYGADAEGSIPAVLASSERLAKEAGVKASVVNDIRIGDHSYHETNLAKVVAALRRENDNQFPSQQLARIIRDAERRLQAERKNTPRVISAEERANVLRVCAAIKSAKVWRGISLVNMAERSEGMMNRTEIDRIISGQVAKDVGLDDPRLPQLLRIVGYDVPKGAGGETLLEVIKQTPRRPEGVVADVGEKDEAPANTRSKPIGRAIKRAQEQWNISSIEIAKRCDLDSAYVNRVVEGENIDLTRSHISAMLRVVGYEVPEDATEDAVLEAIKKDPERPQWVQERGEANARRELEKQRIAARVRALRERLGKRQADLAGVAASAVSEIEKEGSYSANALRNTIKALKIKSGTTDDLALEYGKHFPFHKNMDMWYEAYAYHRERLPSVLKMFCTAMEVKEADLRQAAPESFRPGQSSMHELGRLMDLPIYENSRFYVGANECIIGMIAALCALDKDGLFAQCPNMQQVAGWAKQQDAARRKAKSSKREFQGRELRDIPPQRVFYDQALHDVLNEALREAIEKTQTLAQQAHTNVEQGNAPRGRVAFADVESVKMGAQHLLTHQQQLHQERSAADGDRALG